MENKENEIVYREDLKDMQIDDMYKPLINYAKMLNMIRYNLVIEAQRISESVREDNERQQKILHKIENDILDDEEKIKLLDMQKNEREKRRNDKNLWFLYSSLINKIGTKDAEFFVKKGIEMTQNSNYTKGNFDEGVE